LAPAAAVVAFVGFVESVSVAKAVAARENYKIDFNQELRALGLANVAAAFFSGFPVAGSFSRTAIQHQSGGRTQAASIMTALMILVVLLFLTPLFYYLPNAALAAVILVAVYGLLDFEEARRIFRIRASDGLALLITFFLTILVGVEQGIIAGALFALLVFIRRTAYPRIVELGYVEREDAFLGQNSYPEGCTSPRVLVVRFDARLYFANISFLEDWLLSATAERPDLKVLVIDCRGVNGIDVTAIEGLENMISEYRSRGVEVLLTHVKPQVRHRLMRAGWGKNHAEVIEHQTTRDALRALGLLEDRETRDAAPRPVAPSPRRRPWRYDPKKFPRATLGSAGAAPRRTAELLLLLYRAPGDLLPRRGKDPSRLHAKVRRWTTQTAAGDVAHGTEVHDPIRVGTPVHVTIATNNPVTLKGLPARGRGRPLVDDAPGLGTYLQSPDPRRIAITPILLVLPVRVPPEKRYGVVGAGVDRNRHLGPRTQLLRRDTSRARARRLVVHLPPPRRRAGS
jgi:anti-anti-sigma regulatory factor